METRNNVFGLRRIVYFAPAELGIYTKSVAGGFAPISPATILRDADALAALNGPMFDVCGGQSLPRGNAEYAVSRCDVLEYRHQDGSLQAPGVYPDRGMTFSVLGDGSVRVLHGDHAVQGAKVAIQTYPSLVQDGRSVVASSSNTDIVWRSALVRLRDGRMAFAVMIATMSSFADALVDAGALDAGYTDGGGSTAAVTVDGRAGSSEGRPVPSWLVVRKPSGVGAWFAAAVVGLLVWWGWR